MSRHEPVLAAVRTTLEQVNACPVTASPPQTVVVALSGGPDSVCLFHALHRLFDGPRRVGGRTRRTGWFSGRLHVAHLHHGLRGVEADQDAAFVSALAVAYDCPATIGRADVRREAAGRGLSIQVAARESRYRFLEEVAGRCGADWIAVAHTADDQAETLLYRLLRGTGAAGLRGIPLQRDGAHGPIIRPLLSVTRAAVLDYLDRHRLTFREDRSNRDPHYARSRLRHELLPRLARDYNPRIVETLARTAALIGDEQRLLDELLEELWRHGVVESQPGRLVVTCADLVRRPPAVQRWWLRRAIQAVAPGQPPAGARTIAELLRRLAPRRPADQRAVSMRLRGGIEIRVGGGVMELQRAGRRSPAGRLPAARGRSVAGRRSGQG